MQCCCNPIGQFLHLGIGQAGILVHDGGIFRCPCRLLPEQGDNTLSGRERPLGLVEAGDLCPILLRLEGNLTERLALAKALELHQATDALLLIQTGAVCGPDLIMRITLEHKKRQIGLSAR